MISRLLQLEEAYEEKRQASFHDGRIIPDICHLHHLHVGGEKICHVEKFQNSIKKNLSCGEISEFYKECPKVRMWGKNDKYQVCMDIVHL